MGNSVVVFDGVWKKFRRGERHNSLRDLIPSLVRRGSGRSRTDLESASEFWALRDVSFEVAPGEALGIIGPNGAGKSTVLKLLTRILKPTRGRCEIRGRAGALIEVAAGFHPDLTGMENIYLQGAIMGMKRAEITRKLEQIIDFAGVAEFIDTPVKRYSSGMNARLGFSIAAHLNPAALIIDEVLSVGDMAFQQKCVDRMIEFRRSGVAIVFVSHNLQAISTLCDRALYLKGTSEASGPVERVIETYVRSMGSPHRSNAGDLVDIVNPTLVDSRGCEVTVVEPGARLTLRVGYLPQTTVTDVTFGFGLIRSTDNLVVYDGSFTSQELGIDPLEKGVKRNIEFGFQAHLTRGQYHVFCNVCHNPTQRIVRASPVAVLSVKEQRTWMGVADLNVVPVVRGRQADVAGAFGYGGPRMRESRILDPRPASSAGQA